jgi:hypothetical protein
LRRSAQGFPRSGGAGGVLTITFQSCFVAPRDEEKPDSYNTTVRLSPFRLRLLLSLPLLGCCLVWIHSSTIPGQGSWIEWNQTYMEHYFDGPMSFPEIGQRLARIHESHIELPGFSYIAEYTDSSAPAPFASKCLSRSVSVHYGFLMLISALLLAAHPLLTYKRQRAALRIRYGLCAMCGYDLRAHGSGQKCPECGTTVPSPKA